MSGGVQLPPAPFTGHGDTTLLHWEQRCEKGGEKRQGALTAELLLA